jgi:two-component system, cell cycle sensor histidine kinase and response regulator CckA
VERALEEKQRRFEERMQQAQKLESLGMLAGGIAHDFNNLLAAILGQASLLDMELPERSSAREAAKVISRAAEQAAELTEKLLGFARQGKHQSVVNDLHEILKETGVLTRHMLDKNVEVHFHTDANNPRVKGDPIQLQQVFLNLAINARDAMPGGGALTFRTENLVVAGEQGREHPIKPGLYVVTHVQDTGRGISKEVLPRIFEPFFTTKAIGQGTGLGLSMVYGIVDSHGGFIEVDSAPQQGTEFRIFLPVTGEPLTAPPRLNPDAMPLQSGRRRILVAEDEPLVRTMMKTLLEKLGYEAILTENGREAVEYFEKNNASVDLVIMDMIMPVMDGERCYLALRVIDPGVKVILSSGFGINEQAQSLLDSGVLSFVKKPYRITELSKAIEEALQRE